MTTEELDQVQSQPIADSESSEVSISEEKSIEKSTLLSNDASVSTLMNNYIEKGWITLNDGCPDCNTPLMRNQEATSQVCVNCEINPPLDPEEKEGPQQDAQKESLEQQVQTPPSKPSSAQLITLPPPTSPLPPLPAPEPIRPLSPPNARTSSLDPIMDAMRRIVRSPPSKSTPSDVPHRPPRPTTPLPKPPKTPPPTARPKLAVKPPTPLLPGNSSLISPPSSPQAPKLMPRDKRRSPQSSMVPNSIQPPTRLSPSSSVPTSPSTETAMTYLSNVGTVPGLQDKGSQLINTVFSHAEVEMPSEAHMQTHEFEDVEGKGQESHDEFEDAEEEMVIRSADEVKVRESSRDQSDKITRLMGQKMLQGWTMLQETCPNPKCNRVSR
ncbi:hypothetical protein BGZ46_008826 [Entomortierella lignicola]|nr:hypothetical protein BGZ46_008826 [Entomortierella lignicola]